MHVVEVSLTPTQARKLVKGKTVQLTKRSLQGGSNWIAVSPALHKRVMKAKRGGKGIRIQLTPDEIEASGEGLWDLIKKGAKKVKSGYDKYVKPVVAPILKKGARTALRLGEAALGTVIPELAPAIGWADKKWGDQLVDEFGSRTGAYGLGPLLPSYHPAMNPVRMPPSGVGVGVARCPHCKGCVQMGGSFKPAGGSFRGP